LVRSSWDTLYIYTHKHRSYITLNNVDTSLTNVAKNSEMNRFSRHKGHNFSTILLPFKATVVSTRTTTFSTQISAFNPAQLNYVFRVITRLESYTTIQHNTVTVYKPLTACSRKYVHLSSDTCASLAQNLTDHHLLTTSHHCTVFRAS